jgi:hypothetical protein
MMTLVSKEQHSMHANGVKLSDRDSLIERAGTKIDLPRPIDLPEIVPKPGIAIGTEALTLQDLAGLSTASIDGHGHPVAPRFTRVLLARKLT